MSARWVVVLALSALLLGAFAKDSSESETERSDSGETSLREHDVHVIRHGAEVSRNVISVTDLLKRLRSKLQTAENDDSMSEDQLRDLKRTALRAIRLHRAEKAMKERAARESSTSDVSTPAQPLAESLDAIAESGEKVADGMLKWMRKMSGETRRVMKRVVHYTILNTRVSKKLARLQKNLADRGEGCNISARDRFDRRGRLLRSRMDRMTQSGVEDVKDSQFALHKQLQNKLSKYRTELKDVDAELETCRHGRRGSLRLAKRISLLQKKSKKYRSKVLVLCKEVLAKRQHTKDHDRSYRRYEDREYDSDEQDYSDEEEEDEDGDQSVSGEENDSEEDGEEDQSQESGDESASASVSDEDSFDNVADEDQSDATESESA